MRTPESAMADSLSINHTDGWLSQVRRLYPDQFAWKPPPYEYETVKMPIDILAGGPRLRQAVDGGAAARDIVAEWERGVENFARERATHLLYR